MGLDTVGVIEKLGQRGRAFSRGRPGSISIRRLSCGVCDYCRRAMPFNCDQAALQGYFGFRQEAAPMLAAYPYGGFAEYTLAPARNLVKAYRCS